MEKYLYAEETGKIIGACYEVHNKLGAGFLEPVYQEALMFEFMDRKIPFEKEKRLDVIYKERMLSKHYFADFTCYDKVIIEVKAMEGLCEDHVSQVLNYLKATRFRLGLLVNFGTPKVQIQRVIL